MIHIVALTGPRKIGKSHLCNYISADWKIATYKKSYPFDDVYIYSFATELRKIVLDLFTNLDYQDVTKYKDDLLEDLYFLDYKLIQENITGRDLLIKTATFIKSIDESFFARKLIDKLFVFAREPKSKFLILIDDLRFDIEKEILKSLESDNIKLHILYVEPEENRETGLRIEDYLDKSKCDLTFINKKDKEEEFLNLIKGLVNG